MPQQFERIKAIYKLFLMFLMEKLIAIRCLNRSHSQEVSNAGQEGPEEFQRYASNSLHIYSISVIESSH